LACCSELRFEAGNGVAESALRREVFHQALVPFATRVDGSDRKAAQELLQLPHGSAELVPRREALEERRSIPCVGDRQLSHLASARRIRHVA
jgi:hypothetical protein